MRVNFGPRKVDVICMRVQPSEIHTHDLINLGQQLWEFETIQKDCPQWDRTDSFVMYVLKDNAGNRFSKRAFAGPQTIYRPLKYFGGKS